MKKIFTLIAFSLLSSLCFSQKEWTNWYYDGKTLLTFKNGYAEVVHNFINPIPPQNDIFDYYYWGSGGISYSDSITGDMKFIISNRVGFGSNYHDFPNDTFIRSCPDKFSYHILPFHDNSNRFYVVQFQDYFADLLQQETGLQVRCPNAIGLGYSIADLNLNNGQGDFSLVNQTVAGYLTGQMTTVRHANGKDVWVIVHPFNSNTFNAILFTDQGVQAPVSSSAGPMISGKSSSIVGMLTASHDGKLLAGYSAVDDGLQLFDFDNATGKITNYRKLPYKEEITRVQFSPDDSKLYYLNYNSIFQYDLDQIDIASSLTKIYGETTGLMYDMQLAPDGKIYVTKTTSMTNNEYNEYTGAIECPNLPQYACNFNSRALDIVTVFFPDLINDFIKDPHAAPVTKFDLGRDTSICFGSYTITAPEGWETYKWNTGETTKSITVTKAGTYYVLTGSSGFSCPSGYGYINVSDKAIKLNLGKDTTLCPGLSYPLHINNNYSNILWHNGSHTRDSLITSGSSNIISVNDQNGCYTSDTIGIYFKTLPIADFGPDTTLCNNQPITLTLLPESNYFYPAIYKWQDGSTKNQFTIRENGTYWGSVTYDGCTVSDTITVNYITTEGVFLGNDTTLCEGDSLLLQSNITDAHYLWSTGDTTRTILVKNTNAYKINVSTSNCTISDTINVVFNKRPVFSIGKDTSICENENLILQPSNVIGNFLWQDGSTGQNLRVTAPGLYWLTVTENNCNATDSVNISFKSLPAVDIGNDTALCKGTSLMLNAFSTDIYSYEWQDGSNSSTYLVKTSGMYSVGVTGSNGCKNSDTTNITIIDPPSFTLGNDTTLCEKQSLTYNFNLQNAVYRWSDGTNANSFTIINPGTYWLTVAQKGCPKSDTISVSYKPLPVVNLGNDTTLCETTTLLLNTTNMNATYTWQDGSTNSNYLVTHQGEYFVKANLNNCIAADTINITYTLLPKFSLGNDMFICQGTVFKIEPTISTTVTYLWQDGSTTSYFNVTSDGVYSLEATNNCGSFTDSIKITTAVCKLQMPGAFTPNNDGVNDIFRVPHPFPVNQFNMVVYNRWGQKVFESSDIYTGWNGKYKSEPALPGTYVWFISLTDSEGKHQEARGTILLIR